MTDSNDDMLKKDEKVNTSDEYVKQRDLAAERHSFDKGVAHGKRDEPAWHYSLIDFKAGADWGHEWAKAYWQEQASAYANEVSEIRQQLEAEREDALKYKALYTHWHNEFELKKDELTAANTLIEKLGAALECYSGVPVYSKTGNNFPPANEALAQLEQWRKDKK